MLGFLYFHISRQFNHGNGRIRSNFAVLAHNVDSGMTHRASLASLKKPSSENNNGGREDCWPLKARLCVASGAFFCHVLRILLSELDEIQKQTSLGIKISWCASGMSVIIMGAEQSLGTDLVT